MPFNEGVVPLATIVPVATGSVIVRFVIVAGDSMVNVAVPVAAPLMATLTRCSPKKTGKADRNAKQKAKGYVEFHYTVLFACN
jgi:hypothetical protein